MSLYFCYHQRSRGRSLENWPNYFCCKAVNHAAKGSDSGTKNKETDLSYAFGPKIITYSLCSQ